MSSTLNLRPRALSDVEFVDREMEKQRVNASGLEFVATSWFWKNARRFGRETFMKDLIASVKRRRQVRLSRAGAVQQRRPCPF